MKAVSSRDDAERYSSPTQTVKAVVLSPINTVKAAVGGGDLLSALLCISELMMCARRSVPFCVVDCRLKSIFACMFVVHSSFVLLIV